MLVIARTLTGVLRTVLLTTLLFALGVATSSAETPPVATSVPPPAAPSQASLESIVPQARAVMARNESTWDKASEIRNLVRANLPATDDCGVMATAFWSVGSIVGLPLRIVVVSSNGRNLYDTHSTVEVWLANSRRWAVSDPTFDGFWTSGADGSPLSAHAIDQLVTGGREDQIIWHGAGTANSILPSDYYVDPLTLFHRPEIVASVNGVTGGLVASAADGWFDSQLYVPLSPTDFDTLAPDAQVPVSVEDQAANATLAQTSFPGPPASANQLVYDQRLQIHQGHVAITGSPLSAPGVLEVETASGSWQLQAAWATYGLDTWADARTSPIVQMAPTMTLDVAGGPSGGSVQVRIWSVKEFPAARQTAASWTEPGASILYASPSVAEDTARPAATVLTAGAAGQAYLDLGTSTAYGRTSGPYAVAAGESYWSPDLTWDGLAPDTIYHWRVRFVDAEGVLTTGTDQTFRTAAVPAVAPAEPAPPPVAPSSSPAAPVTRAEVTATARAAAAALRHARLAGGALDLRVRAPRDGIWSFELRRGTVVLARGAQVLRAGATRTVSMRLTAAGRAALRRGRALRVTMRVTYPAAGASTSSTISTTWRPGTLRPASRRKIAGSRTP